MIHLTCTSCRTVLTIDDGFAGGVCRCQHCGAIQTVPSKPRDGSAAAVGAGAAPGKVLFKQATQQESGLDELGGVVASSGLSHAAHASSAAAARGKKIILAAGAALAVLAVVLVLVLGGGSSTSGPKDGPAGGQGDQPKGPHFFGAKLTGPTVIYVLDRGSGTSNTFDAIKTACLRSIASLGKDMKYQVVFWQNAGDDSTIAAYPENALASGSGDSEQAERAMLDVNAFGQSRLAPAIAKALKQNPHELLIVTGKYDMVGDDVNAAVALLAGKRVRVNAFAVGGSVDVNSLRKIAGAGGGAVLPISAADLASYTR
jgi:hypothetical protein